jgi:hypothetical protein
LLANHRIEGHGRGAVPATGIEVDQVESRHRGV